MHRRARRSAQPLGVRTMNTLRWLLLAPAALAAWYAVFVLGLFSHSFVESRLCPPEELLSGFCTNATAQVWLEIIVHVFVALSALAVMTTSAIVAPGRKRSIAWLTLALGTAVAAYLGTETHEWALFASAVAGGFAGLAIIAHWSPPNNALQGDARNARA